jgi:hypothetical protein
MTWTKELVVKDFGKVYYKGVEVELTCANLINLFRQGIVEESLEKEVSQFVRDIKLDILLSKS